MTILQKCMRCGEDVPRMARTTNKKFCSADCRDSWWSEKKSRGVTRGEVAKSISGDEPQIELTDIQAAWLAGLIDGEGTVGIWRERRKGNTSGFRYYAVVSVANTNKELLDAFCRTVNGYVCMKGLRRNPLQRNCWAARVSRRAVRRLLEQVAPYLIVKRVQAQKVMEFCRLMYDAPMRTSAYHEMFERLHAEVKELNRRGVPQEV